MSRILVFANGDLPDLEKARALIRMDDFIICADGGTRHALALGLTPDLVIGDMDSLTTDDRRKIEDAGVEAVEFPRDKNETDLELALQYALKKNPQAILIIAALGGRLDQTLGNLSLLSNVQLSTLNLNFDDGLEEIFFCRTRSEVRGRSGDLVSLIPWRGKVEGVQTKNLKWSLHDEILYPEKTRGISNEMTADIANIEIKSGLLLVVHRRQ